jgi:hypothetical protein
VDGDRASAALGHAGGNLRKALEACTGTAPRVVNECGE